MERLEDTWNPSPPPLQARYAQQCAGNSGRPNLKLYHRACTNCKRVKLDAMVAPQPTNLPTPSFRPSLYQAKTLHGPFVCPSNRMRSHHQQRLKETSLARWGHRETFIL
mmetsp:Transcript_17607/g.35731  ORF Transcript_17607/g.35731 Transcript_17607/m.35731 type:complete len:109 (+) Transcript_17607:80-406(+)